MISQQFTLILFAILVSFSALAADGAAINLKFKRFLQEDIIDFTDDRTVVLLAEVSNLTPKKKYKLVLDYGFAGEKMRKKEFSKKTDKNGEFKFDKSMSLMRFYRKNKGNAKIFSAYLHIDGAGTNNGFSRKTIDLLVLPNSNAPIYRVVSEPLCQWQGETRIDSEYYFNDTLEPKVLGIRTNMTLTRGFELNLTIQGGPNANLTNILSDLLKLPAAAIPATTATTPGVTAPVINNPTGAQAFGPSTSSFFVGATFGVRLENRQTFELGRTWTMLIGQGGYLFRRNTFTRYKAVRFEKVAGVYKPGAIGSFDVGRDAQDFAVVPVSMQSNFEESLKFIDSRIPRLNSCGLTDTNNYPSIQLTNEELQIMFLQEGDLK